MKGTPIVTLVVIYERLSDDEAVSGDVFIVTLTNALEECKALLPVPVDFTIELTRHEVHAERDGTVTLSVRAQRSLYSFDCDKVSRYLRQVCVTFRVAIAAEGTYRLHDGSPYLSLAFGVLDHEPTHLAPVR